MMGYLRWLSRHMARLLPGAESDSLMRLDEKTELETMLEERLRLFYETEGATAFIEPGWAIVLQARRGVMVTQADSSEEDLARVELRTLNSIRSLMATDPPNVAVTRNMLANLATEATRELSTQINRIAEEAEPSNANRSA